MKPTEMKGETKGVLDLKNLNKTSQKLKSEVKENVYKKKKQQIKSSTWGYSTMTEAWDWVSISSNHVPLMVFVILTSKSYEYMRMIHLDHLLCSLVWFKAVTKRDVGTKTWTLWPWL